MVELAWSELRLCSQIEPKSKHDWLAANACVRLTSSSPKLPGSIVSLNPLRIDLTLVNAPSELTAPCAFPVASRSEQAFWAPPSATPCGTPRRLVAVRHSPATLSPCQ